jgi:hypothetical protein
MDHITQQPDKDRADSHALLGQFSAELDNMERFVENFTVPAVLELVGKLGGLNRQAVSLIEAVTCDLQRLQREQDSGDDGAREELQRLLMELRKLSEEVQVGLADLQQSQELLAESVRISGEVMAYLSRVRVMLNAELWEKR